MDSLIKADIFFFISSVAVAILTILASVLLLYLIRAGKSLYLISEALRGDFKESEEFIDELKDRLENNTIFQFFFPPSRRKRRAEKEDNAKSSH